MLLRSSAATVLTVLLLGAGWGIDSTADAAPAAHSATVSRSGSAHTRTEMNFRQIAHGHYKTLRGRWVEAAQGSNAFGGKGLQRGGPDKLAVSVKKIVNGSLVLRGRTLSDGQGLKHAKVVFARQHQYLAANLKDQSVVINYEIDFYPRGVRLHLMTSRNGVKIPRSKNRIVIWTSNNSYTEVFAQK